MKTVNNAKNMFVRTVLEARKAFNENLLYGDAYLMTMVSFEKDHSAKWSVVRNNNSEMNREIKKIGNVITGKTFSYEEDGKKKTVTAKKRVTFLKDAVVADFSELANDKDFLDSVAITTFAIDINKKTIREFHDGDTLIAGEHLFSTGGVSPSSEKEYKVVMYHISDKSTKENEIEIFKKIDKLSGYALSIASKNGVVIKNEEARLAITAIANAVNMGNVVDFCKKYNKSIYIFKEPFTGSGDIANLDEVLKVCKKLSFETPDGLSFASEMFIQWMFARKGIRMSKDIAAKVNFQGRIKHVLGKTFVCGTYEELLQKMVEIYIKINNLVEGEDYIKIGDGPACLVMDSNVTKAKNFNVADIEACGMDMLIMDIAKSSDHAKMQSQLLNLFCCDDLIDDMIAFCKKKFKEGLMENIHLKETAIKSGKETLDQIALACGVSQDFTIVARPIMEKIENALNPLLNKGAFKVEGFFSRLSVDVSGIFFKGLLKPVLEFTKDGYLEVYSEKANEKGCKKAILLKNPSQGIDETVRVTFLSKDELLERIDEVGTEALMEGKDPKLVVEAVMTLAKEVEVIGDRAMLAASDTTKEGIGGHDYDYDGAVFFTDPEIVKMLDKKFKDVALIACMIRYGKDRGMFDDIKLDEDVDQDMLDEIDLAFSSKTTATIDDYDRFIEDKKNMRFGSNVGPVVSAGDMACTLALEFIFKKDGSIKKDGVKIMRRLFKPIDKSSKEATFEDGKRYKTIFNKEGETHVKAELKISKSSTTGMLYLVDVAAIARLKTELSEIDIEAMRREDYAVLAKDLSLCVRALGESSIDVSKKGSAVDLGVDLFDIINTKDTKKLSSNIKSYKKDSNFKEFYDFCLYKKLNKEDAERESRGEKIVGVEYDNGLNKDMVNYVVNGKGKHIDNIIDVGGKLKAINSEIQEKVMNAIGKKVGKIAKTFDWRNRAKDVCINIRSKVKNHNNCSDGASYVLTRILSMKVNQLMQASISDIFDNGLDGSEIKNELIGLLQDYAGPVTTKEVVLFCAFSFVQNFWFAGASKEDRIIFETFEANKLNYQFKLKDGKEIGKTLDFAVMLCHKIFGTGVGFIFNDKIKYEPVFEKIASFKFAKGDRSKAIVKKSSGDVIEKFFVGEEYRGAFEIATLPEKINSNDFSVLIENNESFLVERTLDSVEHGTVVVLDGAMSGKNMVKVSDAIKTSYFAKENYNNLLMQEIDDEDDEATIAMKKEFFESNITSVVGKRVYTPNFNKKPLKTKVRGNRFRVAIDGDSEGIALGHALLTDVAIDGTVVYARDNVLIIK